VERLVLVVVVVAVAAVVALVVGRRRRTDAPTQPAWTVPAMVDRADFARADAPWLVAVFTSATCLACAQVAQAARALESDAVAVVEVEYGERRDLHDRYSVEAVPTLVIADAEGVVKGSYVGPVDAAELWGRMAEIRG
jgi:hypothetical protein